MDVPKTIASFPNLGETLRSGTKPEQGKKGRGDAKVSRGPTAQPMPTPSYPIPTASAFSFPKLPCQNGQSRGWGWGCLAVLLHTATVSQSE